MKAENLKCNTLYYSTRFKKIGFCEAFAGFMAYIIFIDNKDNGWYHCKELEEIDYDKR